MVTAEMFQSLHKKDVMRKMTETFDEVGTTLTLLAFFMQTIGSTLIANRDRVPAAYGDLCPISLI